MGNIELTVPNQDESKALASQSRIMMMSAKAVVIHNTSSYALANEHVKLIKKKFNELEAQRKGITKPIDEAKNKVMDLFRPTLKLLADAESLIKKKMVEYNNAVDEIRRKELAKARDEHRKEQDRLRKEAMELSKQGDLETARHVNEQAEQLPVAALAPENIKASGASIKATWVAEVTNIKLLAAAIADGSVTSDVFMPDMVLLNSLAKSQKGSMNIPGVIAKQKKGIAVRYK